MLNHMDYKAWADRATHFLNEMEKLPGKLSLTVEVAPPLTISELAAIRSRWQRHLPGELIRFWTEASSHYFGYYNWTPRSNERRQLKQVFPYNDFIYGDPQFLAASEVDPIPMDASVFGRDLMPNEQADAERSMALWSRSVIFFRILNGDCLGLDADAPGCDPDDPPVVYLCHDTPSSGQISPSFTDFLTEWEKLSYIGPEWWLLDSWLDAGTKRISASNHLTSELRQLLSPR